jgi:2,3-bisphosphoglycerate-dependent phosphoglycerate mutase
MIYWVRHCSTTGQEPEAPLTDAGHAQARDLAQVLTRLGVERVVSSPYTRAVQSIEPFALESGHAIETDMRLRECVLSTEALPDWQAVLRRTFDDEAFAAPGGETSRDAGDRAASALSDCVSAQKTTLIVSHGNLTSLLLCRLGYPMDFDASMRLSNPDVFAIRMCDGSFDITRLWHGSP